MCRLPRFGEARDHFVLPEATQCPSDTPKSEHMICNQGVGGFESLGRHHFTRSSINRLLPISLTRSTP
jgi:hypothetical protein